MPLNGVFAETPTAPFLSPSARRVGQPVKNGLFGLGYGQRWSNMGKNGAQEKNPRNPRIFMTDGELSYASHVLRACLHNLNVSGPNRERRPSRRRVNSWLTSVSFANLPCDAGCGGGATTAASARKRRQAGQRPTTRAKHCHLRIAAQAWQDGKRKTKSEHIDVQD